MSTGEISMIRKVLIILLAILVVFLIYQVWHSIQVYRLPISESEKELIEQKALDVIIALHSANKEILIDTSSSKKIQNILLQRMEKFKNTKLKNIEVIGFSSKSKNLCRVTILFSNNMYSYLEYIMKFRKIDNKWLITDLMIQ